MNEFLMKEPNRFSPPNAHYFWTSGIQAISCGKHLLQEWEKQSSRKMDEVSCILSLWQQDSREAKRIQLPNPAEPGYPFGHPFELL